MLNSKAFGLLFLCTAFAFGSGIRVAGQLSLFLMLSFILLGINFLAILFSNKKLMLPVKGLSNFWAIIFLLITFYTMLIRGIGFEFLGSSKSGGMFYVQLFSMVLLFIFFIRAKVSARFITVLFGAFFISSALPFVADLLFLFAGGETLLHQIIPGSSTISFYTESEEGLLRIQSAASLAEYLAVLMLVFFPIFDNNGRIKLGRMNVTILLFCLLLIGLSGHRITLVGITLLLIIYFRNRFGPGKLVRPVLMGSVVALGICAFAIVAFEQLPASFQRAFSFLPFTPTNAVTLDAGDSLNFRVLMAAKALVMLPDYFLIGKGFAFFNYTVDLSDYFGIIDLFAEIGVFHNGVLGLLINLGIPGLIAGMAFIISLNRETGKPVFGAHLSRLETIRLVLKSKLLLSCIYFVFLYGDVQSNFLEIVMLGTLFKFVNFHIKSTAPAAVAP